MVYILLDRIDQLNDEDNKTLTDNLQDLTCDKTAIQVMMIGTANKLNAMGELKPRLIDLPSKTKANGDIKRTIDHRINNSGHLKRKKATSEANNAFNLCIYDLEDSEIINDRAAFRTLGKVLMCLRLDTDASIALSRQFSDVSENNPEDSPLGLGEEKAERNNVKVSGPTFNLPAVRCNSSSRANMGDIAEGSIQEIKVSGTEDSIVEKPPTNLAHSTIGENVQATAPVVEPLSKVISKTEVDLNGLENGVHEVSMGIIYSVGTKAEDGERSTSIIPQVMPFKERPEDVIEGYISYDGLCSMPNVRKWEAHIMLYSCMVCYDVDLCSECYHKQKSYFARSEMGEGFWFKVCWADHEFLKEVIDDWHGVRNGIIGIGEKKKLFEFWLEAVKKKWKRELGSL